MLALYFKQVASRSTGELTLAVLEGTVEGKVYQGKTIEDRWHHIISERERIEDWTALTETPHKE